MKILLVILLIGILLVSGCVSQTPPAGGGEPQKIPTAPPTQAGGEKSTPPQSEPIAPPPLPD